MSTVYLSIILLILTPFYLLCKAIIDHSNQMKKFETEI